MTDTAPADWSDQELLQYLIKNHPEQPQTGLDQAAGIAKQAGVGAAKTLVNNAGLPGDMRELAGKAADWIASKFQGDRQSTKGVNDLMTGGGESVSPAPFNERFSGQAAPEPTAGDRVKQALMRAPSGVGSFFSLPTSEQVRKGVEGVTGEFRKPQNTAEEYADTIGSFAPAVVAGPGGFAGPTAGRVAYNLAATPIKRFVTNAAIPGGMSEFAGQATKGTAAEPYARVAGALASPVVTSAWQFARRNPIAPSIPADRQAAYERLGEQGANKNISVGELTGNTNRRYNETVAGTRAQVMDENKLRDLTRAATRVYGEEGENFHEALNRGHARIGPGIEESAGKLKVRMDPELGDALVAIDAKTLKEGLNPDQVNRLRAVRDNIVENFGTVARKSKAKNAAELPDWTEVKGPAFQNLIAKDSILQGAIDEGGRIGFYAKKMKEALMDAAIRTSERPGTREGVGDRQALADFRNYRRQYANMMAMEEGASAGGEQAARGLLTPASLRMIATNRDKSDYFLGRGDYAQLAKDANLLMTPLPNSGTTQRAKAMWPWQLMGTLGGAVLGGAAAPGIGHAVGATLGAAAGPAVRSRMVRLQPWWLDQEVARRRHIANLLAGDVATQQLTHDPGTSQ